MKYKLTSEELRILKKLKTTPKFYKTKPNKIVNIFKKIKNILFNRRRF
jgi:hypothetical protein